MTAIGLVGLPEGFVIGADGRATLDDETKKVTASGAGLESEDAQKIFEITDTEKTLAYATAGFITLDDFLLLDEIKKKINWLSTRAFSTCNDYLAAVAEKVTEEINEAKHTNRIKNFPSTRGTESGIGWKIADLVLVGYFRGTASLAIAQITHSQGTQAECRVISYENLHHSILLGSGAVRKAMYPDPGDAPDARFAQYTKWPIGSLKDAEDYVKGYIAACSSDLGREIDAEHWRITGGHTHLAKITPAGGFAWVIPPKTRPRPR
jgi:hypothetical protein